MNHNEDWSSVTLYMAIVGDIVVLLTAFYAYNQLLAIHLPYDYLQYFVMLAVCYIASLFVFGTNKYLQDMTRVDRFVAGVVKRVAGFVVVWMLMLVASDMLDLLQLQKVLFMPILLVVMLIYGIIYQKMILAFYKRSRAKHGVLFVGNPNTLARLYAQIEENPLSNVRVIGYFDVEPSDGCQMEYLGNFDRIEEYMTRSDVTTLYCAALPSGMEPLILSLIALCEQNMVRFYNVPRFTNYLRRRISVEFMGDVPLLSIRAESLSRLDSRIIKRTFDLILSGLFLISIFPFVYLIFGVLIKLSSPGPILFKQKRSGLNGEEFLIYKFRSMRVNDSADTLQATEYDPRKTRIGDFMRRTNIDELPQFINVFRGDMSVVGPRPHMVKQTEEYSKLISAYMVRHMVKPGVTGWAQISGYRGETRTLSEMDGRVKCDIWYMEHWRFMLDLYIIYKTVRLTLSGSDDKAF